MSEELQFGNVPHPPYVDRFIPNSQTSAWNYLGPRKPVGVCLHSMIGSLSGTDKWFRDGVPSPNHVAKGLTDYGVGGSTDGSLDGVIWRWNDPRGTRAGWASGGSDGLEGDGPMFVRTLGVNAINRDLVSIERSDGGKLETPMSPKQFESVCQLTAFWFDQCRVPYDTFPVNPAVGIVTHMLHYEFAQKDCPFVWVKGHIQEIQDRIKVILKDAQVISAAAPPESEVKPAPRWPNGWTSAQLKEQFGTLTEVTMTKDNEITGTAERGFADNGTISNMWVARCVEEGITEVKRMPKPSHVVNTRAKDGSGSSTLLIPRSGYRDWVGFRGDGNEAWIWLQ